jgi:hypothetical protein
MQEQRSGVPRQPNIYTLWICWVNDNTLWAQELSTQPTRLGAIQTDVKC